MPLRPGEDEPTVELSALVAGLYDRARYDLRIDYRRLPMPPLTGADAAWADEILRSRRAQPAS